MFEIPPQQILSTDSVTLTVDAVIYYRVFDPVRAACNLQDYAQVGTRYTVKSWLMKSKSVEF